MDKFTYSGGFKETCESLLKTYDKCLTELSNVVSGKTVAPDEYAVCNSDYKMRYITPSNIAEYASNLLKVIAHKMISERVADVEKFSVESATRFVGANDCHPFQWTTIMATGNYTNNSMTLKDLVVYCQNEFFNHTVLSKYEMDERRKLIDKDYKSMNGMHFSANVRKIIDKLPGLMDGPADEWKVLNNTQHEVVTAFIEQFILFSISLNIASVVNMIGFCVPRSTYNSALRTHTADVKSNSLLDGEYFKECSEITTEYVTECCLLKTNNMVINNKIPFNINMRNVVLQDMHPNFKDTVSAINFILKDNRSPISQLIWKYGSIDPKYHIEPDTIIRMFIGNPCCKFDNFSNYATIYNRLDFHSDVNWLDKITYGDVYQASNYRRDAVGNDNKHPIQVSLEMLYQMYCPCKCKTNEDLANNIQTVGDAMIGIARVYKECGIENWELVRDILAVMGEIMTKSMIRLYNNHMAVIVAADAMDDTIVPGYMYNEYFLMEADDDSNKPSVTVDNKNSNDGSMKSKAINMAKNTKNTLRQIIEKFSGWVNDSLQQAPMKFIKNHQAEIKWVNDHNTLNEQVKSAIQSNTFKPNVQNWPVYNVPVKEITDENKKLSTIVADAEKSGKIDATAIKTKFYSQFKDLNIDEKVLNTNVTEKDEKNRNVTGEQKAITNYVLYGKSNPNPNEIVANVLTDKNWDDLINNIKNVGPALTKIGEATSKDIKACVDDIKKRLDAVKTTESFEDDVDGYWYNEGEGKETETSSTGEPNPAPQELDANQLQKLFNIVNDISRAWAVGIQNALDQKFYRTSYQLYKDTIDAYKQSNGNTQQKQPEQNSQRPQETPTPNPTGEGQGQTEQPAGR